jgi:hypothetical protein
MKSGMQTYVFLASYAFRSKVLVLVIVKKIREPRSGIIPDPGGIKAPDPGSRIRIRNTDANIKLFLNGGKFQVVYFAQTRVVDPDWFNTDPDLEILLNPDPDPVPDPDPS